MAAAQSCCHARMASMAPARWIWRPRAMRPSTSVIDAATFDARGSVSWSSMGAGGGSLPEQLGNLIDVVLHGAGRRGGVALPERRDHGLVSHHGPGGTPLLLQRQFSRFDQQIVERRHDPHDDAVARRARE